MLASPRTRGDSDLDINKVAGKVDNDLLELAKQKYDADLAKYRIRHADLYICAVACVRAVALTALCKESSERP